MNKIKQSDLDDLAKILAEMTEDGLPDPDDCTCPACKIRRGEAPKPTEAQIKMMSAVAMRAVSSNPLLMFIGAEEVGFLILAGFIIGAEGKESEDD